MNALVSFNSGNLTMSSREIASLLESRHRDVCISITRLMESGAIAGYAATPYTHEQNQQTYFEYFVSKRDSYVIVAQMSPAFTAALVDRWQELENAIKPAIPQTYAAALLEAGRLALENEKQAEQLRLAAPKVEFVNKFIQADSGNMTFRATAKILKINEREFRTFLRDNKIMYLLGGDWVPYQAHIEAGRFEIKAGLAEHDEKSHAFKQSKFTPKGIEWVAGEYAKHMAAKALKAQEEAA
jgi:Uncharacterized phage-encoded protein